MEAHTGDRLVVESNNVGAARRSGEVLEVISGAAGQRLRVKWDDGHETVLCPGSDARIEHVSKPKAKR